jgi:hypothetical protein
MFLKIVASFRIQNPCFIFLKQGFWILKHLFGMLRETFWTGKAGFRTQIQRLEVQTEGTDLQQSFCTSGDVATLTPGCPLKNLLRLKLV